MGKVRNVLFIMCDQLRPTTCRAPAVRISDAGHRRAGRARRALRRAYVQSGVCGPSRMSYYTGRYMLSTAPRGTACRCRSRERTIGDYLRAAGMRVALAGKTHVMPDTDGLERFGIEAASALAALPARRRLRRDSTATTATRRPGNEIAAMPTISARTVTKSTIRGPTT